MKRLANKPFALLGVNSDKDRETLKTTLVEQNITWRSWWDAGSTRGPIQTQWQVDLRPVIFILDGKGIIRYKQSDGADLDDTVDALFAKPKGK